MSSFNKVIILGNLGRDPELRFLPSGTAVCNFSVATKETWFDKTTKEKQERTEWHRVQVFGKIAERCDEFLKKGSKVLVEGRLQTREWTDKEGNKRQTTEINAERVVFTDNLKKRDDGGGGKRGGDEGSLPPYVPPEDDSDVPF